MTLGVTTTKSRFSNNSSNFLTIRPEGEGAESQITLPTVQRPPQLKGNRQNAKSQAAAIALRYAQQYTQPVLAN